MKKLIFVCLTLMFVLPVHASPFLVCDPQSGVETYSVAENGTETIVQAQTDGSIKMDLGTVSEGDHAFNVTACNVWGCSSASPFSFTKRLPVSPINMRLGK